MSPSLKWNQRQKGIDGRKRKEKNNKKYKKRYIIATELLWSIKEQKSYLVVKQ